MAGIGVISESSDASDLKRNIELGVSDFEVELEPRAYVKMLLHAAKYPHCAVNGLLLINKIDSRKGFVITDCIPLFHQSEGLTPMVEVALAQIESRCDRDDMAIAGFYHSSRSIKDSSVIDIFSQRIADKVADNSGHKKPVVLVTLDNRKLGLALESHALLARMWQTNSNGRGSDASANDGSARWRQLATKSIGVDETTLAVTSEMIQRKFQKDLVDFDNHLDDLTQDYLNISINMEVDRFYN